MKIRNAHFVPALAAYYFDDQAAIKHGAEQDGFLYRGETITPGFGSIRQGGQGISVMLELDSGQWAMGDCCAVQYSGAGGRDPLLLAETYIPFLASQIAPIIVGMDAREYLSNTRLIDALTHKDKPLHTALRYGLSQALLDAAALASNVTKTQVVCNAFDLPLPVSAVPLFAQSGDDRYAAVDKMLLKRVAALPHALINNVDDKLGHKGEKLMEYLQWLTRRITTVLALMDDNSHYRPIIHIDVYGTLGLIFDNNPTRVANYLSRLVDAAGRFELYIEGPIDMGAKRPQIECLAQIRKITDQRSPALRIVADEWCNTLPDIVDFVDAKCCHMAQIKTPDLGSLHNVAEAALYCRQHDVEAYQGGTCNETDISARACTQVALACQPDRLLVKPGMGFDEGMQIVTNEMNRTLAQIAASGAGS